MDECTRIVKCILIKHFYSSGFRYFFTFQWDLTTLHFPFLTLSTPLTFLTRKLIESGIEATLDTITDPLRGSGDGRGGQDLLSGLSAA